MIRVNDLGKCYRRYPTHWARLTEWLSGGRLVRSEPRWALRDLNFSVAAGEAVGIVGANGAGKSTLLKILTGTTRPTTGSFELAGRVAALLELGMGFHPDFTGWQNAIMGCQMLGLGIDAIRQRLPEIADFAELPDYMDQPLRCYSTGMQMRLAFSVATAQRPDILIVDEALSVGDAHFQHKCVKRIRAFREAGTTLLFVSHDPAAVKSLCDRALLLDQGRLVREGSPDAVLDYYNALIAQKEGDAGIEQAEAERGATVTRSGSGAARILAVQLTDPEGRPCRAFRAGDWAVLHCTVQFYARVERPTVGMLIRDRLGNDVFGTNTYHLKVFEPVLEPSECLAVTFTTRLDLGYGTYSVSLAVHTGDTHLDQSLDWWDRALVFEVVPRGSPLFVGTAMLPVQAVVSKTRDLDMGQLRNPDGFCT